MKTIFLSLALFVSMPTFAQFSVVRDTLYYSDSSRVTTEYSRIYVGPKGIWKTVNISFDTSSSTQTVLVVRGAAADTNNPAKKLVFRLSKNIGFEGIIMSQDTIRMKTLGGSVPSALDAQPMTPVFIVR